MCCAQHAQRTLEFHIVQTIRNQKCQMISYQWIAPIPPDCIWIKVSFFFSRSFAFDYDTVQLSAAIWFRLTLSVHCHVCNCMHGQATRSQLMNKITAFFVVLFIQTELWIVVFVLRDDCIRIHYMKMNQCAKCRYRRNLLCTQLRWRKHQTTAPTAISNFI